MKKLFCMMIGICFFTLVGKPEDVSHDAVTKVVVLGDRVNLRAGPSLSSETVGQVSRHDELIIRSFQDDWVEIMPPSSVDLWVLGDYIIEGKIASDNVNVRAGAGINFSIVGQLNKGADVTVRGELGPWVSIAPPDSSSIWIHESLVEIVPDPTPEPDKEIETADPEKEKKLELALEQWKEDMQALEQAELKAALTSPAGLDLIPAPMQGEKDKYEGILRPRRFLIGSPSRYRLVTYDDRGRETTICFVKGNREQLNTLINRRMTIHGRVYWVKKSEYPVIIPDRIILKEE